MTDRYENIRRALAMVQGKGAAKAKAPRTEMVWRNPRAVEMTR